jgi:hypothetical protein
MDRSNDEFPVCNEYLLTQHGCCLMLNVISLLYVYGGHQKGAHNEKKKGICRNFSPELIFAGVCHDAANLNQGSA